MKAVEIYLPSGDTVSATVRFAHGSLQLLRRTNAGTRGRNLTVVAQTRPIFSICDPAIIKTEISERIEGEPARTATHTRPVATCPASGGEQKAIAPWR